MANTDLFKIILEENRLWKINFQYFIEKNSFPKNSYYDLPTNFIERKYKWNDIFSNLRNRLKIELNNKLDSKVKLLEDVRSIVILTLNEKDYIYGDIDKYSKEMCYKSVVNLRDFYFDSFVEISKQIESQISELTDTNLINQKNVATANLFSPYSPINVIKKSYERLIENQYICDQVSFESYKSLFNSDLTKIQKVDWKLSLPKLYHFIHSIINNNSYLIKRTTTPKVMSSCFLIGGKEITINKAHNNRPKTKDSRLNPKYKKEEVNTLNDIAKLFIKK